MVRVDRVLIPLLVVAGIALSHAQGAQPPGAKAPAGQPGRAMGGGMARPGMGGIQGFYLLRMDPVQDELKLSDEQKKKIKDFGAKFEKESQQAWAGLREIPAEERQAKIAEIQETAAKRMEVYRKNLEGVLTPQQTEQLKKISFEMSAGPALANPQVLEQIGVTEEQKKKIDQIRSELQAKLWQAQREMADKALKVLTEEQLKQLEETMTKPPPPSRPM
jgi:hypothetical protein